jgi:RNA polymerase sigma-70 factor (ECF subfamily)
MAFGQLVRGHHGALFRVALRMLRSPDDAEDVLQEAWLRAHVHLKQFRLGAEFRTWMVAIVRNAAIDHQRLAWRRLKRDRASHDKSRPSVASPEELLIEAERRAKLTRAISALPRRLQTPLRLWQCGQYSYAQIAEIEGVRIGTIKSRLWQARRRVANCDQGRNDEVRR